ncbi:T9SS type A sorting domain-containing protein [Flavobacterium sp. HBTb2-11-1]|uniref:T9SS type A sorting domain-containing protein n=1 Tax=Flavobacterium sp. HBTb2-11-1 TaxID=2692212 RepID=UPI00136C4BF8|nr:T9SS type A sorting domain-containing protein [Flavobacterium sp. HBTb2-11-1]MXO04468.1 T9SS type A sorting domain-containing protein [Flavobacterium sp. HBTb2-11-1]
MVNKLLSLLILIPLNGFSQMYVGASEPVYVKNQVLYVTGNIDLASGSNIYLRNNSQLLQGTESSSSNSGTGILSVYQEGTSDNFEYNYWCSPVGILNATTGNSNFGVTLLNRPVNATDAVPANILPTGSYDGTALPLAIASNWIYKLTNAGSYSQWSFVGASSSIAPGEGFTMKGTSGSDPADPEGTGVANNNGTGGQRYDFRGRPNDGNILVPVAAGNAATLTGNPYPSALHLNAFLLDPSNSACTRVAYFWEQDKTVNSHYLSAYRGGYGTYSPGTLGSNGIYVPATFNSYNSDGSLNTTGTSSGLVIERKYSPIGQGFLINGNANGQVTFRNSHRVFYQEGGALSQFAKNSTDKALQTDQESSQISHIKINAIINNAFTRQLALAFMQEATDGIDPGIDALNMDDALPNDVSFWLENGKYVIQGINFDASKKVPIAVKADKACALKFYIPETVNFDSSQNVYLLDELDSSYHDIKNGSYEVNVAPGVYNDRFKIAFKSETLGTGEISKRNFIIYQDNQSRTLKALNPDHLKFRSFTLYDMTGKTVLNKKGILQQEVYNFSTATLSSGFYIVVFVTDENERISQKIIISNSGS